MRRILGLVVLLVMLVGCTAGIRPPASQPGVVGEIRERNGSRILVQGPLAPGATNPRLVWVTVTNKTKIAKAETKGSVEVTIDALKVGAKVEVWFDGGVRESYPEQADGLFILVTG